MRAASYGLGESTQLLWEVLEEGRKLYLLGSPWTQWDASGGLAGT